MIVYIPYSQVTQNPFSDAIIKFFCRNIDQSFLRETGTNDISCQVDQAVEAAAAAFPAWKRKSFADRAAVLYQFADRIDEKAEYLVQLESLNCGKPYQRMLEDEMPAISDFFPVPLAACPEVPQESSLKGSPA